MPETAEYPPPTTNSCFLQDGGGGDGGGGCNRKAKDLLRARHVFSFGKCRRPIRHPSEVVYSHRPKTAMEPAADMRRRRTAGATTQCLFVEVRR